MVKFDSLPMKLASEPEVLEESQPTWLSEPSSCIPSTTLDQHSPFTLSWVVSSTRARQFLPDRKGMMSSHFLPIPTATLGKNFTLVVP